MTLDARTLIERLGALDEYERRQVPYPVTRGEIIDALNATLARAEAAEAQVAELREALAAVVKDFDDLIAESYGVAGLHLNGDIAPWSDLVEGGRFEAWTAGLNFARAALEPSDG